MVVYLVATFFCLYGIQRLITVTTRLRHLSVIFRQTSTIRTLTFFSIRCILYCPIYAWGFQVVSSLQVSTTRVVNEFFIFILLRRFLDLCCYFLDNYFRMLKFTEASHYAVVFSSFLLLTRWKSLVLNTHCSKTVHQFLSLSWVAGGGGAGLIFTQCEIKKKVNPVVLCIWIFEFSHNLNLNVYAVNMHHILNCHKSWKLKRYLLVHKPYVASPSAMKLSLAFRVLTAHWQCTSMRLLSGSYGSLNAKLWSGPNLTLFYPVVINETELY